MLIKVAVTNFRSIRERVELTMQASKLKGMAANVAEPMGKHELLKTAVIYGANASGKSSLLRALKAVEYLVVRSTDNKPNDSIAPYEPHKFHKLYATAPVSMEIEFFADSVRYEYHLEYTAMRIEKEVLFFYPKEQKTLLYTRLYGKPMQFGEAYRGGKRTIEKQLLDNQLFLSKAASNNASSVMAPYLYFKEGSMVFPFLNTYRETRLGRLYARKLADNANPLFAKKFNALICALDTGISSVVAEETDWNKYQFPENVSDEIKSKVQEEFRYDVKTYHHLFEGEHSIGQVPLSLEEESTGTQSLFVIGGIIVDALERGQVLIIDEFEKNLHPVITRYLVQLFHDPLTNPHNAQLVVATHDVALLAGDMLRRDQVWFTEKNEFGATQLYRSSDIKGVRLSAPLDKWYISGRLGATALINDTDFLLEMQHHDTDESL